MDSPGLRRRVVRFGVFQIDFDSRELFKNGRQVRLSEQPFQLLTVLLEHPGEVATREYLRSRLWPEDTYVDFDRSLNTAASRLRDALGDSAENPVFIQTIPRRGYRFAAPVVDVDPEAVTAEIGKHVELPLQRTGRIRKTVLWISPIVVLLLAFWYFTSSPAPKIKRVYNITGDGRAKTPELATDGARVFFSEWHEQHWTPAHVPITGGYTELIPTPFIGMQEHACVRGITSDKSHLLVVTGRQRTSFVGYALWEVTPSGSSGRRLGDLIANDGSWSPDGSRFAYATKNQIWISQADGRAAQKVAEVGVLVGEPRWSPDAKRLRFTTYGQFWERSIWEMPSSGGVPRPILPEWTSEQWGGMWTPDARYFIFNSESNLWALSDKSYLRRSKPYQLTVGPLTFYSAVSSLDGRHLIAVGELRRSELFRYDVGTSQFAPVLPGISATQVEYSRDGAWMLYVSYPEGELWRSRSDGSNRQQLTRRPLLVQGPRWSPDSRRILVSARNPRKPWKVYTLSAEGGVIQELAGNHEAGEADWSPDGSHLVIGNPALAQVGLAVLELRTGKVRPVERSAGLRAPRWSPNGRYISARKSDNEASMLFDVKQNSWTEIKGPGSGCVWENWMRDSAGFFCIEGKGEAIHRFEIKAGKLQKVVDLRGFRATGPGAGAWLGVTAEGSPLIAREAGTHEIYALEW